MKIVVAGGSGFIGSHVVDVLLDKGHEVLIYDLEAPHYGQKCGFVRGDTRDIDRMTQVFKSGDIVYLIAAEANVNRFFESPLFSNDITANGDTVGPGGGPPHRRRARHPGVHRMGLRIAARSGRRKHYRGHALYRKSGPHLHFVQDCRRAVLQELPESLWRELHHYAVRHSFRRTCASGNRYAYFHPTDPRGEPITIHGDGSQSRQFIYVKDLARGNAACLNPAAENQIFNLNGKKRISVIQIVKTIEEILGKKASLTFVEDRKGNFKGRFISSEKARRLLDWEAALDYEEAMRMYVAQFLKS